MFIMHAFGDDLGRVEPLALGYNELLFGRKPTHLYSSQEIKKGSGLHKKAERELYPLPGPGGATGPSST
jgi:hypothetical protein